ncbi:hypothetical protein M0R72_11825 [Candidatus Pacearchaeota archaeon]|jgi:hypothetical protein|nr:hypothetical protein [Candidatus Pacearchaeota archaeon]
MLALGDDIIIKTKIVCCCHKRIDPKFAFDYILPALANAPEDIELAFQTAMEALIDRSRSIHATKALEEGYDVLVFIDDDIRFRAEDLYQLIREAHERKTVVGCLYTKRKHPIELVGCPLTGPQDLQIGGDGKIQEVKYVGTGLVAIPRLVLASLADVLPKLRTGAILEGGGELHIWPFFMPMARNGIYLSEDYAFCQRAIDVGFHIFADARIILGHVGEHVYSALDCKK